MGKKWRGKWMIYSNLENHEYTFYLAWKPQKNCSKPCSYESMSSGSGSGSGSVLIVKVLRSSTCSFINLGESVEPPAS